MSRGSRLAAPAARGFAAMARIGRAERAVTTTIVAGPGAADPARARGRHVVRFSFDGAEPERAVRALLAEGKLEERQIEIEVTQSASIDGMMIPMGGGEGMDYNFTEMLQDMLPKKKKRRTVSVAEARRVLLQDHVEFHPVDPEQ